MISYNAKPKKVLVINGNLPTTEPIPALKNDITPKAANEALKANNLLVLIAKSMATKNVLSKSSATNTSDKALVKPLFARF